MLAPFIFGLMGSHFDLALLCQHRSNVVRRTLKAEPDQREHGLFRFPAVYREEFASDCIPTTQMNGWEITLRYDGMYGIAVVIFGQSGTRSHSSRMPPLRVHCRVYSIRGDLTHIHSIAGSRWRYIILPALMTINND